MITQILRVKLSKVILRSNNVRRTRIYVRLTELQLIRRVIRDNIILINPIRRTDSQELVRMLSLIVIKVDFQNMRRKLM